MRSRSSSLIWARRASFAAGSKRMERRVSWLSSVPEERFICLRELKRFARAVHVICDGNDRIDSSRLQHFFYRTARSIQYKAAATSLLSFGIGDQCSNSDGRQECHAGQIDQNRRLARHSERSESHVDFLRTDA